MPSRGERLSPSARSACPRPPSEVRTRLSALGCLSPRALIDVDVRLPSPKEPLPMKRIVLSVLAAGVLVVGGLTVVGAAPASAKYRVGVGEQKAAMFESPA